MSQLDNIDDSVPMSCSQPALPGQLPQPPTYTVQISAPYNNHMTLTDISLEVSKHYRKNFDMQFIFPIQCVDGAVVEIQNRDTNVPANLRLLATARLRYSPNGLSYDRNNGNLSLQVYLNDLSFERKTLNVCVNDPNSI
jgi:hypothetical protein